MSGHVGGREGLLPDQQDLRHRPARAGTAQLKGQDDGGESGMLGLVVGPLRSYHVDTMVFTMDDNLI